MAGFADDRAAQAATVPLPLSQDDNYLLCASQLAFVLFYTGVVLCLFCGSLDFSLSVRPCQTSSVTIGQPAEYSILMQNSGKDNARFCFSFKDDWLC